MKKLMLYVLCFVFIYSIAGCGIQSETAETAEELITLTLTPEYARDITDELLDANIGTDYQFFERIADGSIVLKMSTDQYVNYIDTVRLRFISIAQNMVTNDHNNFTDISFNDNFSEFQVTVKTDTLHRSDADYAYFTLEACGRFYHYLTTYQYLTTGLEDDLEDCSIVFTFLDREGNILETDYNPD